MYRLLSVFALMILGLVPLQVHALALGDIELHSALNQPLDAQVELLSLGETDLEDLHVQLASPEDFDRVGLDRPFFLTGLRFRLAEKDGTPYLFITTKDPLKEPFIDFLISVKWPNGRLLREYTLLLDPPVFLEDKPAPVQAPQAAAPVVPAPVVRQAPQAAATQPRAPAHRSVAGGEGFSYGPVTRSDTLWSIARQMRPDDSVTVPQVMMALLKNNPQAFYHGNVNYLKAGYVLRLPGPAAIAEIDPREAERQIMLQNQQWEDARRRRAGGALPRPAGMGQSAAGQGGASHDGESPQAAAGKPRLRLVVPEGEVGEQALQGTADKTEAGASTTAELDALRRKLALAMETSEAGRQENAELRQRLATLEEQINKMQRLLSLRNDTLSALESGATTAQSEQRPVADQPAAAPERAAGENQNGEPGQGATAATAAVTPAKPPSARPTQPLREQPPEDFISQLLADPMLLGAAGGAGLLMLALGWVVVRRRRAAAEMDFQEMPDEEESEAKTGEVPPAAPAGDEATGVADDGLEEPGEVASAIQESNEGLGLDVFQADEDEIDTLAEADVYLAYRRFDKAEELLKEAIAQEPHRHDYVLKLLEVYAACENREAFLVQAEALHAGLGEAGGELWDKAVSLGRRLLPEHPLFGGEGAAEAAVRPAGEDEAQDGQPADASDDAIGDEVDQVQAAYSALSEMPPLESALPDRGDGEERAEVTPDGEEATPPAAGEAVATTQAGEQAEELDIDLDLDELQTDDDQARARGEGAGETVLAGDEGVGDFLSEEVPMAGDDDMAQSAAGDSSAVQEMAALEALADEMVERSDAALAEHAPATEAETLPEVEVPTAETVPAAGESGHEEATAGKEDDGTIGEVDIDWLANLGGEDDTLEFNLGMDETEGEGEESDLISGEDEVSTKLDLARAYIDMGDQESARNILDEVLNEGNDDQKGEAQELIRQIG